MSFLYLVIAGVIMGGFTVITGGGAGALYVSILTLGFNVSPVVATATSLATMFPVAAISSGLHAKSGNINFKIGWIMIGWGTIGALIGSYFSNDIPTNHYNRLIGSIIILLTVLMIIKKRQPVKLVKSVYHSNKYTFCQTSFFGIIRISWHEWYNNNYCWFNTSWLHNISNCWHISICFIWYFVGRFYCKSNKWLC